MGIKEFLAANANVLVDAIAGACGGTIATLIFHPLENIRTKLQAYESGKIEKDKLLSEIKRVYKDAEEKISSVAGAAPKEFDSW